VNELPSISIVIPVYNSEKVLRGCLQSVREQDYPKDKMEIIIADAGSTDKTLEIVNDFTTSNLQPPTFLMTQ